jgi:hypothetical protein
LVLTGNGIETQRLSPLHLPIFSDLLEFAKAITS